MQSVVEVATHVAETAPEAIEDARDLRAKLRDAAAERGLLIASAGTHPFSRYEHQEITEAPRYEQLAEAMQWVAERELIFGLHVHVGLDSAQQAIGVANALRTWLPELLVERGVRTNSFRDYTYIWWDLRPHPKLGTIETRICDAQTRLESVAAIVALVQSLVATLAARYERDGTLPIQPVTLIGENKWRAARYGLDTQLIHLERDEEVPARDAVLSLAEQAAPAARRLGCAEQLAEVERICTRGAGADEQRRVHAETDSLLAVAQWLAETTVSDL